MREGRGSRPFPAGTGLRKRGELGLVQWIHGRFPERDPAVLLGIGDDAAAFRPSPGKLLLTTIDTLREGVHFSSSWKDPYSVGWKSVAVSLSDIAAMGGIPRFLLLSLALPDDLPDRDISRLLRGVRRGVHLHGLTLIGGNLSRSGSGLSVETVLIGEVEPGKMLTRSGGRIGDAIYVTGTLGDASAGLALLNRKGVRGTEKVRGSRYLIDRHLRPTPRLREGRLLAARRLATSAIDLSDGLLQDLSHLCAGSRTGARIDCRRLPLSSSFLGVASRMEGDPIDYPLSGGEDYEILFTVSPRKIREVEALGKKMGIPLTRIGEMTDPREGLTILDLHGDARRADPRGFDHFRSRPPGRC